MLEDDFLDKLLEALRLGGVQGAIANWGDELSGDAESFRAAREGNPLAYAVGEFGGAFAPAFAGAGLAKAIGGGMGGKGRLLTALLFGGAHGALAGSGGYEPGDLSGEERARDALIGAGLGGALGGLGVPGTRAARDLADNAPALLGRVRDAETGAVRQALPGTGTRASAPLELSLATEGATLDDRAAAALQRAMRLDETEAAGLTGQGQFGRFTGNNAEIRPFEAFDREALATLAGRGLPQPGRSTASLIDMAAQSPSGAAALNAQADEMILGDLVAATKKLKPKAAPKGVSMSNSRDALNQVRETFKFFDDPQYTDAFIAEARRMTPAQKNRLAKDVLKAVRQRVGSTTPEGASALRSYLQRPDVARKLKALGVKPGEKTQAKALSASEASAQKLRARATRSETPAYADDVRGFRNVDDRLLAGRGELDADTAAALLRAAVTPTKSARYLERIDPEMRLLRGAYRRGTKFNPRSYFADADIEDLMGSVKFSQPVAAALPGLLAYLAGGH